MYVACKSQGVIFRKLAVAVAMVIVSALIIYNSRGSTNYSNTPITKDAFFFDTYISLTIYDSKDNYSHNITSTDDITTLLNNCIEMCDTYEKTFSRTLEASELYKLTYNEAFLSGKKIAISDSLYECINETLHYSAIFGHNYSILSGGLCDLWDYNTAVIPDKNAITDMLNSMNLYTISLKNNYISLVKTGDAYTTVTPKINLGASAKGYIADKLCSYLKDNGIKDAIIDLGGNIVVIGNKYDDSMYKIGVKKPFSEDVDAHVVCKVADKSIVTSGIYERYFKKDDIIYHHIIDCSTGYPAVNDILSVTIIADNSLQADCYSTGCLLLGSDAALTLINSTTEVECIIIDKNYKIILSEGLTYEGDYITLR